MASLAAALLGAGIPAFAQPPRVLGIDVSTYQGNIGTANWATLKRATNQQVGGVLGDGRDFVFIRSSRGGTTGEDHRQGGYAVGNNTFFDFSERYDDPYFVQNISRATAAGMFAGAYHLERADIVASSTNSDGTTVGVANDGTDEANHFIQMAAAWMRPGYLLPVLDFEKGAGLRTTTELSSFAVAFSDRIYQQMGIHPLIYVNSSYANSDVNSSVASSMPDLWIARPTPGDPFTTEPPPAPGYPNVYGVWNPSYPTIPIPQPWKFWQYSTSAGLNGYSGTIDKDAANGGMEYLKDHLVPALWMNDMDGQWTILSNWNSGAIPVAPVASPGQLPPIGTQTLPTPSLPGANDTVILDRPTAAITVTLATGIQTIRKLYVRETLNITGGSLSIKYVPSSDSTPMAAQFSGPVTLNGSGSLSVHTLQVDATRTFTLGGGSLTFNTINLMPDSTTPAKIAMTGDVNFNSLAGTTATVAKGTGTGNPGSIDLGGAARAFNVADGSADVDLSLDVPVTNGALSKTGAGTMRLSLGNSYSGGTTISNGRLLVNNTSGTGSGNGGVTVNGGALGGTGTIGGAVTVNSGGTLAPGTAASMGKLTLHSVPAFSGTNFLRIDRNGGAPLADKLVLSSGILNYGGTLVVSNAGATLAGGEVFTNFVAPAYSGTFAALSLPALNGGLNWDTGGLTTKGAIKVNRSPVIANPLTFTNVPPLVLQIPIASLTSNATDADGDSITLTGLDLTSTNGINLLTNDTFIFYSNYVSVLDQFNYTIGDGHGGSATGAVYITSSPTGRFTGFPSQTGTSETLHFAGRPGWTYYVERSTNLPVWVTISTNVAPASGVFDYTDDFHDLTGPASMGFYRLRW